MRKHILLLSVFFVIIPNFFTFTLYAQGAAGNTVESALTNTVNPQIPPSGSAGAGSSQSRTSKVCVKVGEPPEPLPAVCTQPDTAPAVPTTPKVPGGPRPQAPEPEGDIRGAILEEFGITMNGYPKQNLQWAWEKFWEISNTNFNSLVRGSLIQLTSVSNSQQIGCPGETSVLLGAFSEESAFKHVLIHELGHVIRNCAGRERAQETAFLNALEKEGGVSYYGQNAPACTGSDRPSEDYAEMIAYYLNPGVPVASYLKCYQASQSPYSREDFPLHYQVARDVLGDY